MKFVKTCAKRTTFLGGVSKSGTLWSRAYIHIATVYVLINCTYCYESYNSFFHYCWLLFGRALR